MSLRRLLARPVEFPVEVSLSNGEKYVLPHPDHAYFHLRTADLVIDSDNGLFFVVLNPDHIVSLRTRINVTP